jgi:hypothetical protein
MAKEKTKGRLPFGSPSGQNTETSQKPFDSLMLNAMLS